MTVVDPQSWTPAQTEAFNAKRRARNRALGIVLGVLAVVFWGITVVRMIGP